MPQPYVAEEKMRKTICLSILFGAVLFGCAAFAQDWSRFDEQDNRGSGYKLMPAIDQQRSYSGTEAFESGSVGPYGNGAIGPYGNGAIGPYGDPGRGATVAYAAEQCAEVFLAAAIGDSLHT